MTILLSIVGGAVAGSVVTLLAIRNNKALAEKVFTKFDEIEDKIDG